MQVKQSSQDGMAVLTLAGPLDLAAAPQLQATGGLTQEAEVSRRLKEAIRSRYHPP